MFDSTRVLEDLGFTRAQAHIYLTLLSLGPSKVGKLIEKSGLQSSTVHNTLIGLIDKGYVSYVERANTKIYQASNPSLIKAAVEGRVRAFEDILPRLQAEREQYAHLTSTEIFEGVQGIFSMLLSFLEDSKPGDPHWFFATVMDGADEQIQDFFSRYDVHRLEHKLDVRGVAPMHVKKFFRPRNIPMCYLDFPIPGNINLSKDKMTIITWGPKPTGILIQSRQLVEQQTAFFKQLWSIGKK